MEYSTNIPHSAITVNRQKKGLPNDSLFIIIRKTAGKEVGNVQLRHIAVRSGRLSSFLKQELGLSTGLMNRLKWKNQLFVNGEPRHADYPVCIGDEIVAVLDDPMPQYPAQDGPLSILYEDDHLLCVDKPAGMLIHPSRSCFTHTLANYVLGYFQKTGQNCAFHPVTRLDRDTFGVVLLAKNTHIHHLLSALHEQGKLIKTYEALVCGTPDPEQGIIHAPIGRLPLPSLLRQIDPMGKPSVTEYRVVERLEGFSRVSLRPVTGRTHQLRVHCQYMGFPILGDPQYNTEKSRELSAQLGYTSQVLCAVKLSFPHPITGKTVEIFTKIAP